MTTAREQEVVEQARTLLFERAMVQFKGELIGSIAAIPDAHRQGEADLNYHEIFVRDNVPVMVYLLTQGKTETVRHFLDTCLHLQSGHYQTRGIFPTSFVEQRGRLVADYGQRAIGRVVSVDATLWWPILACIYVQRSGDLSWAEQPAVQLGLQRVLDLILHPQFRDAPTLYVPDGAFMIDRPLDVWGAPLEIQVLLYGALVSTAALLVGSAHRLAQRDLVASSLDWARRLRRYLLKHYWVNRKTVQVLRRRPTEEYGEVVGNEYNIQTEMIPHWLQSWLGERGGFLIGNIRTGRPDFRFFTLGNCLGAIFEIISPRQQRALLHLFVHNREDLVGRMPLRICHPPLEGDAWRLKTGFDRKNLPWCYHNAGHWPCLMWFLTAAVLRRAQRDSLRDLGAIELVNHAYQLMLDQLPRQRWAEYFDGPTGLWTGQQARYNQTWTIVSFLMMHHLLRVNPADAAILDLPSVAEIAQKLASCASPG